MKKHTLLYFMFFSLSISLTFANKRIDSLLNILNNNIIDTTRIYTLNDLSRYFLRSDIEKSTTYVNEAIEISTKLNNLTGLSNAYNIKGIICRNTGKYDEAFEYMNKSLEIRTQQKDTANIGGVLVNIGGIYYYKGEYSTAISYYIKATEILEKIDMPDFLANVYNNIGLTYHEMSDFSKSLDYLLKSAKIREEINDSINVAVVYNNIGTAYKAQKNYDLAISYYEKSIEICKKNNDKHGVALAMSNIGGILYIKEKFDDAIEIYKTVLEYQTELNYKVGIGLTTNDIGEVYLQKEKYNEALKYFKDALDIQLGINDKKGLVVSYHNFGKAYFYMKDYDKALAFFNKSLSIAKEAKINLFIQGNYEDISNVYAKKNDYKKSLEYYKLYSATKDSIFDITQQKQMADAQTKYETEKKEKEILLLNKDKQLNELELKKKEAEINKQRILTFSFVFGFIIILVFSIFLYRLFIHKKKANVLLSHQNEEIKQQKEEIETQRDEIDNQRKLVFEQKNHIEEIYTEITDSITYAKRIQQAILPNFENLIGSGNNSFILFKPKDIVSGDFYWSTKINDLLIITVADCTGHGVPGAFMSMLGVSFLNEIVRKKEVIKANQVLDNLRESIIEALQQKAQIGDIQLGSGMKDGMDISLCVINTTSLEMQFAGANNPLYIVKSEKLKVKNEDVIANEERMKQSEKDYFTNVRNDENLIELKGDKMPVAIYDNMKPFTNHEIQLKSGDCIYLTSDGYQDQFGGNKDKKFMSKKLKQLFLDISEKPMAEQKEILNSTFENWKGEHEQIDDVTILGLKI